MGKHLLALAIALIAGVPASAQPPIIALPTLTSVTVKLTPAAGYTTGTDLKYEIRHWPDNALLAGADIPATKITSDALGYPSFTVTGLNPLPWTLQDPQLYTIAVSKKSSGQVLGQARFGFRTFEVANKKFELNGRPIFLRSVPINPPGRDLPDATGKDPDFIRGYLKLLKSAGVNLIRTETEEWLNACDELGIMVSQLNYGPAPGSTSSVPPPVDQAKLAYRAMVLEIANHPSVTIYILTNEVTRTAYDSFLTAIREDIRLLDPTRPVIGNAGFGKGQGGEIYDHHQYLGWYSANAHEWYALNDTLSLAEAAGKPMTISEYVAAYTSDAGVFQTRSKQMSTMLRWAGPGPAQRANALWYQAELTRQAVEIARRLRTSQRSIAGVMPFTYFLGWANAKKAEDLIIKPAFDVLKVVFQPVLISPECWKRNLYAGDSLQMQLYVINDDDTGRGLAASQAIADVVKRDGTVVATGQASIPAVAYYSSASASLSIPLPSDLPKDDYTVKCRLVENGTVVSKNSFEITVAPRDWPKVSGLTVRLYDPENTTAPVLQQLGVQYTTLPNLSQLPDSGVLVFGERAFCTAKPTLANVLAFLDRGGRILCLRQPDSCWSSDWLPASFTMSARTRQTCIQPMGWNPTILKDLRARDLRYWNECSRYSNGTPAVEPVLSLLWPASHADLANARVWAASEQLLSGAALLEIFQGKGSIIISQFRCTERAASDPIAAKVIADLVAYAASSSLPGRVDLSRPVKWNLGAFRTGVFCSKKQGFLPHSPVYQHTGTSKGLLGADHSIDGFTLVGNYDFNGNGWLQPVPDPAAEGWGVFYGTLTRRATKFTLKARNPSSSSAQIRLKLDGVDIGSPMTFSAGQERTVEWTISRQPGPVSVELRGDQDLVILETAFR